MAFLFNKGKKEIKPETRIERHESEGQHPVAQIRWDAHDLEGVKGLEPQPAFTGFNSPPGRF